MKALGIDIGGSALKGAPVDTKTGRLLAERFRIPTPEALSPKELGAAVAEMAAHFRWKGPIGVGFPGVIEQGSIIRTAANVNSQFIDLDGGRLFAKATGCPVTMINDAAAAGVAEMRFGAGKGLRGKVMILTLGTGVGSCLSYEGVVVPLELGHFPWKNGKGAEKHVAASVREAKGLSWKEWSGRLSDYLVVLEKLFWPELFIIGGGISAKHDKFFPRLKTRAPLVPAKFLNQAGIVGAALWAAEHGRKA